MKKLNVLDKQPARFILLAAFIVALAAAFIMRQPQPVQADYSIPALPDNIQVPAGSKLFLVTHATGTQNYVCLPSATSSTGVEFKLFTPQATLFDDLKGNQTMTHYFGPNPDEGGTIRAAWQFKDSSIVWGKVIPGDSSTDPAYVDPNAIAWLKVTVVGHQNGPTGGDKLSATTYIQRVNTSGGKAPSTGCASSAEIGNQAFVPYTTDYLFYE